MLNTVRRTLQGCCGLLAAAALFAIMWLTLVDVTGRKFFNHSVPGGLELTEMLMVMVIFGALPLVSWRGEHVVFDSLDHLVPASLKNLQARLVHAISAGLFGLLAWLLTLRAERFDEYSEVTVHLQWPMAPVAWVMAALLALTALVHVAFMLWPQAAGAPGGGGSDETNGTGAAPGGGAV